MRFPRRAFAFCACALLFAGAQAAAEYRPKVSALALTKSPSGPVALQINGRQAFRFLSTSAGLTPTQRAAIATSRLQNLVDSGADPKLLATKFVGPGQVDVMWGDKRIFKVTGAEAKAHGPTPSALAEKWVGTVRWLLTQPPLTIWPKSVTVPVGETRRVAIGGVAQGAISVANPRPDISTSAVSADGRCLVVTGVSPGDTSVALTRNGASEGLDISVRKYAGRMAAPSIVEVTGHPTPGDTVLRLAEAQVSKSMALEPGAQGSVRPPMDKPGDLQRGSRVNLTLPVTMQGEGYLPVKTSVVVSVVNQALPDQPTASLMYSNSPERVTEYGLLFFGRLAPEEPARLLYHHQNVMGKPFLFSVLLVNAGPTPARLQIIRGIAEPEVDTVAVGCKAGVRFLRNFIGDIGEIVELPPITKMAVTSRIIDKLNTASGVIQFRQLEGAPIYVRLAADSAENGALCENTPVQASAADIAYTASPWVYPLPTKRLTARYVVGKSWSFIRIGKHAIKDADQTQELFGNYGVLYDITLELENPTSTRKQVEIAFEAGAGIASGFFLVDGKYVKVTHVKPPGEVRLARYSLGPRQTRTVTIKTSPLAGSAYPATILARS